MRVQLIGDFITKDLVTLLRELGFTDYQSKVYNALVQLGTGTAKDIAKVSKVPGPKVYSCLTDMAREGIVDYYPSFPKKYRAADLELLLPRLLELKRGEVTDLETRANEAIEALSKVQGSKLKEYGPLVWVCEGRNESIVKATELVEGAKKSVDIYRRNLTIITKPFAVMNRLVNQRDVRVRVLTSAKNPSKSEKEFYGKLNLNMRYLDVDMPVFMVVDGKRAFVALSGKQNNIIVYDKPFAQAFGHLFADLWSKSKKVA